MCTVKKLMLLLLTCALVDFPSYAQPRYDSGSGTLIGSTELHDKLLRVVPESKLRNIILEMSTSGLETEDSNPDHILEWHCERHNCTHNVAAIVNVHTRGLILCYHGGVGTNPIWYVENSPPTPGPGDETTGCPAKISEIPRDLLP